MTVLKKVKVRHFKVVSPSWQEGMVASFFLCVPPVLCTTMSELAAEVRKIVKEESRFSPSSFNGWFPSPVLCLALSRSTPRYFYQFSLPGSGSHSHF